MIRAEDLVSYKMLERLQGLLERQVAPSLVAGYRGKKIERGLFEQIGAEATDRLRAVLRGSELADLVDRVDVVAFPNMTRVELVARLDGCDIDQAARKLDVKHGEGQGVTPRASDSAACNSSNNRG